jgi:hypothetical protein
MSEPRKVLSPPYPAFVDMGRCKDCTLDWRMTGVEYKDWIEKKLPSGMSMPKRCPDCRSDRRKEQQAFGEEVRRKRGALGRMIRGLAEDVKTGRYEDDELIFKLVGLAEMAEQIPDQLQDKPRHNEPTKRK